MSFSKNSYVIIQDQHDSSIYFILERIRGEVYIIQIQLISSIGWNTENARLSCSPNLRSLIINQTHLIERKLRQSQHADDFAQDLMTMIEQLSMEYNSVHNHSLSLPFSYYNVLLSDLELFGWEHVQFLSESLQQVNLVVEDPSHRKHDVQITLPTTYPDGFPQCQVALPAKCDFSWERRNTISDIYSKVRDILSNYDDAWSVLEDFDSHCIILDPAKPTFEHNYRRIFLENQCSMYYTVNIEKPRSIGDWKFLGPPSEVDHFDQLISKNMNQWDTQRLPRENIETILEIQFQNRNDLNPSQYEMECAICYTYQLFDHGHTVLPDKCCTNPKKAFHFSCLYGMLQSNPTTKQSFNMLYGSCPYCQTQLTLRIDESGF